MKKALIVAGVAIIAVLASCSNPSSLPPVTTTDRDQAMTALSNIGGAYASFSYGIVYWPDQNSFENLITANSYAIITITVANYTDVATGYTISGTLEFTMTNGSPDGFGLTLMEYSGTFDFSGSGNIRTATMNVTVNMQTFAYTGTVTLNGTTFTY